MEDMVARAIMMAWSSVREGLVLMHPKTLEEQLGQPLFWNPRIRSEDGMMLGQKKYFPLGRMLGYNVSLVREWDVFKMKRSEGQFGSISCKLENVTQLINKVVDGLDRFNKEEGVWSGWFVGQSDGQIIRGKCPSNEYRLWGNLSGLSDNDRWLAVRVAVLEGKKWQVNPDPAKLDNDCKLWLFDNKPLHDLEWDPLEVWW